MPSSASRRAGETIFGFLRRAEGAYWARVRDLLEQWFAEFPPEAAVELKRRFEGGTPEQVVSAFWELYIHEGFRRSGFDLTPHPDVPGTAKRPDFLAQGRGLSFYLECVVSGDPEDMRLSERRRRQVYDAVNRLQNDQFFLNLSIRSEGESSPSGAKLRERVDAWLARLDRAELRHRLDEQGLAAMPQRSFEVGDWVFEVMPIPKSDELAGEPSNSAIGIFPGRSGGGEVRERLVDALDEKASRYGQLDWPYLVAVLSTGSFADDEDVFDALFGQIAVILEDRGGADWQSEWTRNDNGFFSATRHRRVSGVITATQLTPWSVQSQSPRLWLNPWAQSPVGLELDWLGSSPIDARGDGEGEVGFKPASVAPDAFFNLPPDWPGPEGPFE
jgi:hypothetical protein